MDRRPRLATAEKLRELASWYREFAERAGTPNIWDLRLRTAEDLDAAADAIDRAQATKREALTER